MKNLLLFVVLSHMLCWSSWAMEQTESSVGLVVTIHQKTLTTELNEFWDNYRKEYIEKMINTKATGKYNNVYFVIGELVEDDDHMKFIWNMALTHNKTLDYVSFVHGGDQWLKDEWGIPVDSKQIRMVYSEACKGGNGVDHFIKKYGAFVSAGHNKNTEGLSASPLFSFVFLASWLEGKSFAQALNDAWLTGMPALEDPFYFQMAQKISRYSDVGAAIEASRFQYAHRIDVDPAFFNIDSKREELLIEDLEFEERTIANDVEGIVRIDVLKEVFKTEEFLRPLQKFMAQG